MSIWQKTADVAILGSAEIAKGWGGLYTITVLQPWI